MAYETQRKLLIISVIFIIFTWSYTAFSAISPLSHITCYTPAGYAYVFEIKPTYTGNQISYSSWVGSTEYRIDFRADNLDYYGDNGRIQLDGNSCEGQNLKDIWNINGNTTPESLTASFEAWNSFYYTWYSLFLGVFVAVMALHGLIKYA